MDSSLIDDIILVSCKQVGLDSNPHHFCLMVGLRVSLRKVERIAIHCGHFLLKIYHYGAIHAPENSTYDLYMLWCYLKFLAF
jgi:hypothetical protein